ncbi:MAG TPA: hypothetical protein VKA70_17270 [Blastocatellia bacterium]|nr:hypothetical protein [Blastocatellia bacterium]
MHCPNCGAEHTFGLKYCKRCGLSLGDQPPQTTPLSGWSFTGAAWAIGLATVAICLGGLGIVVSHAFDLLAPLSPGQSRNTDPTPIALAMIVFGTTTVFGIAALLIRLFSRLLTAQAEAGRTARFIKPAAAEYPIAQIPAQPVSSVTEHTTRNFERLYEEQRAREPRGKVTQ